MEQVIWAEEMDRAGAPALVNADRACQHRPAIMQWGTGEQKERFLRPHAPG